MNNVIDKKAPGRDNPPAERERYWKEQVSLKQNSGLSAAAYCRLHGISWDQFGYWERKFRKLPASPALVPVRLNVSDVSATAASLPVVCSVTLRSGAELKLHDVKALSSLLSILG